MADADLEAQTSSSDLPPRPPAPVPRPPSFTNSSPTSPLLGDAPTSELDVALRRLELFLTALGYSVYATPSSLASSALSFAVLGLAVPALAVYLALYLSDSTTPVWLEEYQVARFEICALVFQALLAAASLGCVSHCLRKYGLRRFLFVDRDRGQVARFQKGYVDKIQAFFSLLLWWTLPCFIVKIVREIWRFSYVVQESKWRAYVVLIASIASWVYLTTVYLCACIVFNLVCNLQALHFEDFIKLLEGEMCDHFRFLEDHIRLRFYLSKISHRFRICLLLLFLFVSASEVATLIQTTGYPGVINFVNAGDFTASSVVQVVGIVLCLNAATKISHRALGISAVASKWHASITCSSTDSSQRAATGSNGNMVSLPASEMVFSYSESDLESLESLSIPTNSLLASYISSYHKRQALVTYLQSNPGGITIFGWMVDRSLINTIFFLQLSLVLFVLGKTLVFS